MKFTQNVEEMEILSKIGKRANKLGLGDVLNTTMDVDACHSNGCPLRLQELLEADETNFVHDVTGIRRYVSRRTGKLTRHFVPRYAGKGKEEQPCKHPQ